VRQVSFLLILNETSTQVRRLTLIGDKLERTGEPKERMPFRIGVMFGRTGGPVDVDTIGARLGRIGAPKPEENTSGCLAGLFIGIGMMGRLFTEAM
jgi:hypothetical protein